MSHKRARYQTTAHFWAIKPKTGDWEGYTSLDVSLFLPSYTSTPGDDGSTATIPAMRYRCARGVSPTAIPTRLDLSKQRGEVTVLAFDPQLLENGFYDGAEFEAFEINYRAPEMGRDVILTGTLGTARVGRSAAQVELWPWVEKATRATGNVCGLRCNVGRLVELPDEQFGTHRCAGECAAPGFQTPNDGPQKANWTARAVVTGATDESRFRVLINDQAQSGRALPPPFATRLEIGRVEFFARENGGGANFLQARDVKWGVPTGAVNATGTQNEADLELALALDQAPEVGAVLWLTAGCRRTQEDCHFYGNFSGANPDNPDGGNGYNFQGFHRVPGRDDALRRWSG